jgi:hypothetical protein
MGVAETMSKSQEIALGLRTPSGGSGEERKFERGAWFHMRLVQVVETVMLAGGAVGVYTSRDQAATGISIKVNKDRKVYWFGPDDDVDERFDQMEQDWGMPYIDNPLMPEIERYAHELAQGGQNGA